MNFATYYHSLKNAIFPILENQILDGLKRKNAQSQRVT